MKKDLSKAGGRGDNPQGDAEQSERIKAACCQALDDFDAEGYAAGLEWETGEASAAGLSLQAFRIWLAATGTQNGTIDYGPSVASLAEVGMAFEVSERWAASLRKRGMPGEPGRYNLQAIRCWLEREGKLPAAHRDRTPAELPRRYASGELARAVFRTLRIHLPLAIRAALCDARRALDEVSGYKPAEILQGAYLLALAKHLAPFLLDDEAVEATLRECWPIV